MNKLLRECSICTAPIDVQGTKSGTWYAGHSSWPVNEGRCCTWCNNAVVIPFRVALMADIKIAKEMTNEDGSVKKEIVDEYISSGCFS